MMTYLILRWLVGGMFNLYCTFRFRLSFCLSHHDFFTLVSSNVGRWMVGGWLDGWWFGAIGSAYFSHSP